MKVAFARAFEQWEREYREAPDKFMSRFEIDATPLDTMGDKYAKALISYLDELADGRPWDQIV